MARYQFFKFGTQHSRMKQYRRTSRFQNSTLVAFPEQKIPGFDLLRTVDIFTQNNKAGVAFIYQNYTFL